jgi:hypothetical protein
LLIAAVGLDLALAVEPQAPLVFTKKPTAMKIGDSVRIEFAVSREADVAVFIEDLQGKVVRHLVAGVLGTIPPPPLKADVLEQSVQWDRNSTRQRWSVPNGLT